MDRCIMAPSRDVVEQTRIVVPKARKCSPCGPCRLEPSQPELCQRSRLTSSLQAASSGCNQIGELELILQGQAPDVGACYLGVSPPVRSGCYGGAANPIQHDDSWSARALNASHTNLQALRELDSQHSFLRCTGDYRLLLGSPDVRSMADELIAERVAQSQQTQQPSEPLAGYAPFTCRAQYFAVR